MTLIVDWVCMGCKHYTGSNTCLAFPEGIPKEIYYGDNTHTKPLEDQENDLVFEPLEEND